jgi:hypothetical protein
LEFVPKFTAQVAVKGIRPDQTIAFILVFLLPKSFITMLSYRYPDSLGGAHRSYGPVSLASKISLLLGI